MKSKLSLLILVLVILALIPLPGMVVEQHCKFFQVLLDECYYHSVSGNNAVLSHMHSEKLKNLITEFF